MCFTMQNDFNISLNQILSELCPLNSYELFKRIIKLYCIFPPDFPHDFLKTLNVVFDYVYILCITNMGHKSTT